MKAVELFCVGTLAAVQLFGGVEGHGHVYEPPSRVLLCNKRRNYGCWTSAENSIQNNGRFPSAGPWGSMDGVIASAMMAAFRDLDQQGPDRWVKTRMRPGRNAFKWYLYANHPTADFRYWITKQNWDPSGPLRIDSFEPKPIYKESVNRVPPRRVTHHVNVPHRTGYQIILAEWQISDSGRTFYNVIDLDFSGNGGGGKGPATFGLQPLTRYHNRFIARDPSISRWNWKGKLCLDNNDHKGCKRNTHLNVLNYKPRNNRPQPQPQPQPRLPDLKPGSYAALKFAHSGRCLAVQGASKAYRGNFIQDGCSQSFAVGRLSNGYYVVKARHSGLCLDLTDGSRKRGANFQQWGCRASNQNQMFRKLDRGNGYVQLQSKVSGMCVSVYGAAHGNGANVLQWPCRDGDRAQWLLLRPGQGRPPKPAPKPQVGYVPARFAHSGHCLGVNGYWTNAGADLEQHRCSANNDNQAFKFQRQSNGYYTVKGQRSRKCLSARGGSGDAVVLRNCNRNSRDQQFQLLHRGNGQVAMKAKASGMCVSVRDQATRAGSKVVQYPCRSGRREQMLRLG